MVNPRIDVAARPQAPLLLLRITALAACVLAVGIVIDARAQTAPGQPPGMQASSAPQQSGVFSKEELAQVVAPVALYPDALLAQVLMASTYPGDVADAAAWSKAHPDTRGDAAVKAVASQPWDPSVQALVAFPAAIGMLGTDINWTQKLGDAFLAQPDEVMKSVQELRKQAQTAGNLSTNEYQKVSEQTPQTIVIESTQPDVVYVPSYNPTTVYGGWMYPGYPPMYYPPAAYWYPGAAFVSGFMWGVGISIAGGLWGNMNWGGGDININSNRYNNFTRNNNINRGDGIGNGTRGDGVRGDGGRGNGKWQHDGSRRDGVPYRDQRSREQYGNRQPGADNRANFRGDDPGRAQSRDQARQSMERQGMQPAQSNQQARDRAASASRDPRSSQVGGGRAPGSTNNMASRDAARSQYGSNGSRNNAFSGSNSGGASRAASNRGGASRSSMGGSRGGGGRSMSRPSRGGGGGRRR